MFHKTAKHQHSSFPSERCPEESDNEYLEPKSEIGFCHSDKDAERRFFEEYVNCQRIFNPLKFEGIWCWLNLRQIETGTLKHNVMFFHPYAVKGQIPGCEVNRHAEPITLIVRESLNDFKRIIERTIPETGVPPDILGIKCYKDILQIS